MSHPIPRVYLDHLQAVTNGHLEDVRRAWEPDGVLEFPYATSLGTAQRLEGVEAIVGYFSGLGIFRTWSFHDMRAWKVDDLDEWVLEMHGSSTFRETGAPYEQDYIVRFGLGPNGKLSFVREFWDPTRAAA